MSRAARFTLSATALIALGAAAFFIVTTEQQIAERRLALRAFDLHAREAAVALADARAGQQAYVAAGQSSTYWIPKVGTIVQEVSATIDSLRSSAASASAGQALLDASSSVTEFGNIDKRVRDYLKADESLMASDVVFSEGTVAASHAAVQVESARLAEHQAFDADEAGLHRLEAFIAGGAAGFTVLILVILGLSRGRPPVAVVASESEPDIKKKEEARVTPKPVVTVTKAIAAPAPAPVPAASSLALKAAADLCTEFGRIHDLAELKALLGRAARVMDASGLVVWLGNADGADLQPVLAHGYSDQVLSLMRPVPRSADNAAAAAYRSGGLQLVSSRQGSSAGAVVAPLLSAEGCIGALTAEVKGGGEKSDQVQALAAIFAAQLAGILAASAATPAQTRTATA